MTDPNRIYHYTSIETLAVILKSRKLRFTRLDQVDDALEAPPVGQIASNKYFFVSCWTAETAESIPQWHLYTNKMTGVRIELPGYPFCEKVLTPPASWIDTTTSGTILSPLDFSEMFGSSYFIMPMFTNRQFFAGPVQYVDDVEAIYRDAIRLELTSETQASLILGKPFDLVRYKTKPWSFQQEYRFSLFALPSIPLPPEGPGSPAFYNAMPDHAFLSIQTGTEPGIRYIDVDIDSKALEQIVVTTGPLCSVGSKLAVEALVAAYAPSGNVRSSALEGKVKPR